MEVRDTILVTILSLLIVTPLYADSVHEVVRVIDGDSIVLDNGQRVRMLGYNTVERGHPLYYKQGKSLTDILLREFVIVEDLGRDRYKRILGIITLRGKCINALMRAGLKRVGQGYRKYDYLLSKLQTRRLEHCGWRR